MSRLISADRDGVYKSQVEAELSQLAAESAQLKEELDVTNQPGRQGEIRRRRAYLNRRIDALKVERTALTSELQLTAESLKAVQ